MTGRCRKPGRMGPFIEGYRAWLAGRGYAAGTIVSMLARAGALGRWMDARGIGPGDLDQAAITEFRDALRAGEPARQPHQVRVIQLRIRIAVPAPPPGPEPARAMAQRVIRVQHDPVHAVIRAGQQVPVPFGEVIGHAPTVEVTRTSRQDISRTVPKGPLLPGEVPGGA